jgi:S-formylglutathione hydrolase
MATLETICEQHLQKSVQGVYRHAWVVCAGPMRFAVRQPPRAPRQRCPVLTGFIDRHLRQHVGAPGLS